MEVIDFVLASTIIHPKHRGELWERKIIDHERHLGQENLVIISVFYFLFIIILAFHLTTMKILLIGFQLFSKVSVTERHERQGWYIILFKRFDEMYLKYYLKSLVKS